MSPVLTLQLLSSEGRDITHKNKAEVTLCTLQAHASITLQASSCCFLEKNQPRLVHWRMRDHVGQRADDPAKTMLGKPDDLQLTTDIVDIGPAQPRSAGTPNQGLVSKNKCLLLYLTKDSTCFYTALLSQ